jgi:hypothetical protein
MTSTTCCEIISVAFDKAQADAFYANNKENKNDGWMYTLRDPIEAVRLIEYARRDSDDAGLLNDNNWIARFRGTEYWRALCATDDLNLARILALQKMFNDLEGLVKLHHRVLSYTAPTFDVESLDEKLKALCKQD